MLRFADIVKLALAGVTILGVIALVYTGHAAADPLSYHYGNYGTSSQYDQNPSPQQFNNTTHWPSNTGSTNYSNTTNQTSSLPSNQSAANPSAPTQSSGSFSDGSGIATVDSIPAPVPVPTATTTAASYPMRTDYQDYQHTPLTSYTAQKDNNTKPPCPTPSTQTKPCPPTPPVTPAYPKPPVTPVYPSKPCPTHVRPPAPKPYPITTTPPAVPPQQLTMSQAAIVPASAPVPAIPITPAAVPTAVAAPAPTELTNTGINVQLTSVIAAAFLAAAGFVFSRRTANGN